MIARAWAVLVLGLLLGAGAWAYRPEPGGSAAGTFQPGQSPVDFEREVRPILEERCWGCHAQKKHRGGLRLDSREAVLQGGDSGPAAEAGKGSASLLVQLVSGADPERLMPDEGERLTADQIAVLTRWIDEGLVWGTEVRAPESPRHEYQLALRPV